MPYSDDKKKVPVQAVSATSNTEGHSPQRRNEPSSAQGTLRDDSRALLPAVDIQEDETGIHLIADMPGVPKDALSLEIEGDVLNIAGEIRLEVPPGLTPLYNELSGRRYARSFTLSKELDGTGIKARMEQGVLRLHIPKAEALKPRKVEVSFQ
jgi:HSP20 family protein